MGRSIRTRSDKARRGVPYVLDKLAQATRPAAVSATQHTSTAERPPQPQDTRAYDVRAKDAVGHEGMMNPQINLISFTLLRMK